MKRILFIFMLVIGVTVGIQDLYYAQTAPPASPVPPAPQLSINDLKLKIADLVLANEKQAEYIQTLQNKIVELQGQIDKSKPVDKKP